MWPYDEKTQRLCSVTNGGYKCNNGYTCGSPLDVGLPFETDPIETMPYLDFGQTTFYNLFLSLVTIIQCITLDGWTKVMYNLKD